MKRQEEASFSAGPHVQSPPMASLILGPLLRYVGRTQATIWIETDGPCTVTAPGRATPTFEVEGHHYALVVLDDLPEGEVISYQVELDGERVWPAPGDEHPPSVIRTREGEHQARLVFGSCRVGAPQREPYTLSPDEDDEGFGVDALWAYSRRLQAGIEPWPDGLLLIGDQVYADEVIPETLEFIRARRDVSGGGEPGHAGVHPGPLGCVGAARRRGPGFGGAHPPLPRGVDRPGHP